MRTNNLRPGHGPQRPRQRRARWHVALLAAVLLAPALTGAVAAPPAGATPPGSTTVSEAPVPSGGGAEGALSALSMLSCPTTTWCLSAAGLSAVGGLSSGQLPTAETYSSGSWSAQRMPLPTAASLSGGVVWVSPAPRSRPASQWASTPTPAATTGRTSTP